MYTLSTSGMLRLNSWLQSSSIVIMVIPYFGKVKGDVEVNSAFHNNIEGLVFTYGKNRKMADALRQGYSKICVSNFLLFLPLVTPSPLFTAKPAVIYGKNGRRLTAKFCFSVLVFWTL